MRANGRQILSEICWKLSRGIWTWSFAQPCNYEITRPGLVVLPVCGSLHRIGDEGLWHHRKGKISITGTGLKPFMTAVQSFGDQRQQSTINRLSEGNEWDSRWCECLKPLNKAESELNQETNEGYLNPQLKSIVHWRSTPLLGIILPNCRKIHQKDPSSHAQSQWNNQKRYTSTRRRKTREDWWTELECLQRIFAD